VIFQKAFIDDDSEIYIIKEKNMKIDQQYMIMADDESICIGMSTIYEIGLDHLKNLLLKNR
jgi:hypothetical protein